jgi:hypothetical protein
MCPLDIFTIISPPRKGSNDGGQAMLALPTVKAILPSALSNPGRIYEVETAKETAETRCAQENDFTHALLMTTIQ